MLSPLLRCGRHIDEALRDESGRKLSKAARRAEAVRRLAEVGIHDPTVADRYPFELSGGMRQRVGIAAALARDPAHPDRRRALHRAGRDHAEGDPRPSALAPAVARDGPDPDHPRPARRVLDVRPDHGALRRLGARGRACAGARARAAATPTRWASCSRSRRAIAGSPRSSRFPARSPTRTRSPTCARSRLAASGRSRSAARASPRCARSATAGSRPASAPTSCGSRCARRARRPTAASTSRSPSKGREALVSVEDLTKVFESGRGERARSVTALAGVSVELGAGESVGLVGESGSGQDDARRAA